MGPPPRAFSSEHTQSQETPFCRGFVGVLLLISPSSAPHPAAVSVLGSRWDRALAFNAPAGWKGLELGSPSWLPPRSRRLIIAESAASKLIRPKSRLPLSRTCPSNSPHPLGYGVNLPQQSPPCPPGVGCGSPALPAQPRCLLVPCCGGKNPPKEVISAQRGGFVHQEPTPQPQRLAEEIQGQKPVGAQPGSSVGCPRAARIWGGGLGVALSAASAPCPRGEGRLGFMARSEGFGSNPKLMAQVSWGQTASDTQPGPAPRPLRDKDSRWGWAAAHLGFGIPGSPPPSSPGRGLRPPQGPRWLQGGCSWCPGAVPGRWLCQGFLRFSPFFLQIIFRPRPWGGSVGHWEPSGAIKAPRGGGTQKETVPRSGQDGAERGQAGVSAVSGGAHSVLGVPRWLWCPWGDRDVPNVTLVS